jgi:hypothetical protein
VALIGSLALSVVAKTERLKQDLKPALDAIRDWGKAAEAAGLSTSEINREMARMRSEAARGPKEAAAGTAALNQSLSKVKQGVAAVSGAISAMSSEVGGAIGHVARLGTNLTSSFLAGGPVALGVAAISAGFSAIAGSAGEAEAAINKTVEATAKLQKESAETIEQIQSQIDANNDRLAVEYGVMSKDEAGDRARDRAYQAFIKKTSDQMLKARGMITYYEEELAFWEKQGRTTGSYNTGEIGKRRADLEHWQAELKRLEDLRQKRAELEGGEIAIERRQRERAAEKKEQEERDEKLNKAGQAAADERVKSLREELEVTKEIADERAAIVQKEKEDLAGLNKRITDAYGEEARRVAEGVRAQQSIADGSLSAQGEEAAARRVAELRARVDAEQDVAEAAKQAAAATKEKVEAEKQATEAVREQRRLVDKQADITKRFANFGGGSLFGFGAGQAGTGLGDIGRDAARARQAAGNIPSKIDPNSAAGQIAGGKGLNLPDLSPQLKAIEAEIAKIPPWYERMSQAVTGFGSTTRRVVGDLGRATDHAVGSLRADQDAMEAEVRSLAQQIERSGGGTGTGD